VRVWLPTARLDVLKLAVVLPLDVLIVPWPRLVVPSEKVTIPDGATAAALPGSLTVTVVVKVTVCPERAELTDVTKSMLVLALATVSVSVPELARKLLSPK
jgi:hypothetical protein